MTKSNPKHTDTSRSGDLVDDDFAPIWDESILLAEHEAVQASVAVGGWLSAALDAAKDDGWRARQESGDWLHLCPDCL